MVDRNQLTGIRRKGSKLFNRTYLSEGAEPANNRAILHNAGDHGRYSESGAILRFRARGHRILANRPNTAFRTLVNTAPNSNVVTT